MYNERLEQLIDAALADGELTEKEKQILFKKAQEMGVDLDEFEMVLDARLVKLKKAEEEKAKSSAPKSNKFGDVKKCPSCGAMVQSYQGACPDCGYAFEDKGSNTAVIELSKLLQRCNNNKDTIRLINTFPMPIEKAALIEFIYWLLPQSFSTNNFPSDFSSKSNDSKVKNCLANAYWAKYEECIQKVRIGFANDPEMKRILEDYENNKIKFEKLSSSYRRKEIFSSLKNGILGVFSFLFGDMKRFVVIVIIAIVIFYIILLEFF